ncbi:unnamed protein product [Adineta steineri]|uniref:Uncharacterized protein n=1 Tax=Adineta steineri TaxID=433720 RepID=A0A814YDW4_9BILA|nr:unnamed protein product [Adineta steineri]CAF3688028.1 unnamed protein product [Adineta steineri]
MLSIFLLLLISIQNLHGLICYTNNTFYFSQNDFNWNNFSINNKIQQLVNSTSCHVRIIIDNNNNIIIKFDSSLNNNYNITHIEFGSTIKFFNKNIQSISSYLDYTCLSGNLCDKIFIEKWIKKLLIISKNSLYNNFISLWKNSSNTKDICHSEKVINTCESYLCFMIYDELKYLSYEKSQCNGKLPTNPIYIYIKTYSGNRIHNYQCMKNLCTKEVLYKLKYNSTEELIDYKIQDYINKLNVERLLIIVGILIIIGSIAYSIQCRKYRQGYRLTKNIV